MDESSRTHPRDTTIDPSAYFNDVKLRPGTFQTRWWAEYGTAPISQPPKPLSVPKHMVAFLTIFNMQPWASENSQLHPESYTSEAKSAERENASKHKRRSTVRTKKKSNALPKVKKKAKANSTNKTKK